MSESHIPRKIRASPAIIVRGHIVQLTKTLNELVETSRRFASIISTLKDNEFGPYHAEALAALNFAHERIIEAYEEIVTDLLKFPTD